MKMHPIITTTNGMVTVTVQASFGTSLLNDTNDQARKMDADELATLMKRAKEALANDRPVSSSFKAGMPASELGSLPEIVEKPAKRQPRSCR